MASTEDEELILGLHDEFKNRGDVVYFNSARTELSIRCPYCGDSTKSSRSAHLYIATVAPFTFFCQRCQTKGFLNRVTLRDFNVDDADLIQGIAGSSRSAIQDTTKRDITNNVLSLTPNKKLIIPEYKMSTIFDRKLGYLENRIGRDFNDGELRDVKFIADYGEFLSTNRLKRMFEFYEKDDYSYEKFKWLQKYSVGFLSYDTNYIGFRHSRIPSNGRRYHSESMNAPLNIGSRMYTIGNDIDILTPTLNVVVAEGVLDIVSIFYNIYDGVKSPDTLFGSANGKSYRDFITNLRRMGFTNINLDIYSDSEIDKDSYRRSLNLNNFKSVKVHYNVFPGESDFGVAKEKIKVKTFVIKR